MNVHHMKLQPVSFESVRTGSKTIEIRLNDEKRQALKVGDIIEFTSLTDSNHKIETKILGLDLYPTFKDLFVSYPPEQYGGESEDEWTLMYKYYSPEDERQYGVVAIRLTVLNS